MDVDRTSNLVHDLRAAGDNCPDYGGTLREAADEIERLQSELADLKQFEEWARPQIITHGKDMLTIERLRLALGRAAFRWRYAATNWGLPQRAVDECLQYAEDCAQGAAVETDDEQIPQIR